MGTILIFNRRETAEVIRDLAAIYPAGLESSGSYKAELFEADPIFHRLRSYLENSGLDRMDPFVFTGNLGWYSLSYTRVYDDQDISACEFVELRSPQYMNKGFVGGVEEVGEKPESRLHGLHDGPVMIDEAYIQNDAQVAHVGTEFNSSRWPVVRDNVKRLIESAGFIGPTFLPTALTRRRHGHWDALPHRNKTVVPWESYPGEQWWELTSSVTLPPVSHKVDLRDLNGRRIGRPNDELASVRRLDGQFGPVELHYSDDEIRKLPAWDLAHTREAFFGRSLTASVGDRSLVASSRLRRWCEDNRLGFLWTPVRLDSISR